MGQLSSTTMPNDPARANALAATTQASGALAAHDFHQLADVQPTVARFANIDNHQTRRAYQHDVQEFMTFTGSKIRRSSVT